VKLLLDENLSPRLVRALADVYPGSAHVHDFGLGSADDDAVWQYAKDHGFTLVSKDSDFQERSVIRGFPPKVVWLRATNCTTAEIEKLLRAAAPVISRFVNEDKESCLLLWPREENG
jgi:predicted nuclease of predicted toxin-antitoxin system